MGMNFNDLGRSKKIQMIKENENVHQTAIRKYWERMYDANACRLLSIDR